MSAGVVAALVSIGMVVAGLVWNAARSFERLERLREDLRDVAQQVRALRDLLYTTVGGRRTIRPIETADENGRKDE